MRVCVGMSWHHFDILGHDVPARHAHEYGLVCLALLHKTSMHLSGYDVLPAHGLRSIDPLGDGGKDLQHVVFLSQGCCELLHSFVRSRKRQL